MLPTIITTHRRSYSHPKFATRPVAAHVTVDPVPRVFHGDDGLHHSEVTYSVMREYADKTTDIGLSAVSRETATFFAQCTTGGFSTI